LSLFGKDISKFKIEFTTLGIFGICFVISLFFVVHHTVHQQHDAVKINLAGRQRMLSQKLAKELFLFKEDKISAQEVINTITVFDTTLIALTNGGEAPLDLLQKTFRTLPAMDIPETKEKLQSVISLWSILKENSLCYLKEKNDACLSDFFNRNDRFLHLIDATVTMMQERSEKNNFKSQFMIYLALILFIIVLVFLVVREIVKLAEASQHIEELEHFLPICSHCKRIRLLEEDPMAMSSWVVLEDFLNEEKDMKFSHGICPSCAVEHYPGIYEKIKSRSSIQK